MEIRCSSKLHGIMVSDDVIEVSCSSRFCGSKRDVAVRHRINVKTGEVVETLHFKDLATNRES